MAFSSLSCDVQGKLQLQGMRDRFARSVVVETDQLRVQHFMLKDTLGTPYGNSKSLEKVLGDGIWRFDDQHRAAIG